MQVLGLVAQGLINADEGIRWPFSFLSADRRRPYCLYEASSPAPIIAAVLELSDRLGGWAGAVRAP